MKCVFIAIAFFISTLVVARMIAAVLTQDMTKHQFDQWYESSFYWVWFVVMFAAVLFWLYLKIVPGSELIMPVPG